MAASNITVRQATPRDLDAIVAFNQAMAMETEGKALGAELLRQGASVVLRSPGKGFYLVAEADGRVVGGLLITYEWSDWHNASYWWIQSVYVEPGWRRKGVYRALHNYIYDSARSRGDVCGIRLYVERSNHVAQQTYTRLGMAMSHYDMYEIDFPTYPT